MPVRLVTGPVEEPVTLEQAKSHLRLDTTIDDAYLQSLLIPAARQYIERVCWRGLLVQSWELTLAGFRGEDRLDLIPPWRPVVSSLNVQGFPVNWLGADTSYRFQPYLELPRGHLANTPNLSITYLDENGASQTLPTAQYLVENTGNDLEHGRIWLNSNAGYEWPNTLSQFNAVTVRYDLGWDTADDVPAPLKQAILIVLAQMYEHRTPEIDGRLSEAELTSKRLCGPYRFLKV